MRLELAERLICPGAHAPTPLIVVAQATDGRDLLRGSVGCMTCRIEATITDGTLSFDAYRMAASTAPVLEPTEALVERLAALLALDEPGRRVLLGDTFQAVAPLLVDRYDCLVAVLDAWGPSPRGVGHVRLGGDRVPFADATFDAAALDSHMTTAMAADAVRCLRVGARVLGDVSSPPPARVRELARDATQWVGEVDAPAIVVPLRRA